MSWNGDTTTGRNSKHVVTDRIGGGGNSTSMMENPQHKSQLHQQRQNPMPPSPMLRRKYQQTQRETQYQQPSSSFPHRNYGETHIEYATISERIVDSYNQNNILSSHHQQAYPTSLLLSPTRGIKQQESDESHTSFSSYQPQHIRQQQQQHHHQPPFLTIVLMKIDQLLPTYCQHLSYPSHTNAALACTLFDSVTGSMSRNSPISTRGISSSSNNNNSSKSTASENLVDSTLTQPVLPIKRWFPLPGGQQHSHNQQRQRSPALGSFLTQKLALENEWETYVSPFLLFAAAEVLYAKFVHLQSSPQQEQHQHQQQQQQQHLYPLFFNRTNTNQKSDERIVVSPVVSLIELYQRIDQDLRYIQEILCEPFLRSDTSPTASMTTLSFPHPQASTMPQQKDYHRSAAISVTDSIRVLSVIVSVRCQMITLLSLIFVTKRSSDSDTIEDNVVIDDSNDENHDRVRSGSSTLVPTFYEAAGATTIWLQTVEVTISTSLTKDETRVDDTNEAMEAKSVQEKFAVLPLLQTLQKELKAWKYCFETCYALERCKFMDAIISLRCWQLHLPSKENDTTCSRYMNESFQRIRSLLPIYFDRTRTYANHCYGINTSLCMDIDKCKQNEPGNTEYTEPDDFDSIVVDFLHRQNKLGGPSMAIGILLDAMSTSNLHVERGFSVSVNTETSKSDDVRTTWPAIYLRSTMHLPTPTPPKNDTGGSGMFASSQASLLSNWAAGNSYGLNIPGGSPFSMTSRKQPLIGTSPTTTPPSHRKGKTLSLSVAPQLPFADVTDTTTAAATLHSNLHALEYGPESGTVTSWPHNDWASITRILNDCRCQNNMPHVGGHSYQLDALNDEKVNENEQMLDKKSLVLEVETELSTVYCLSLGPFLNFVILVKDMDDNSRLPQRRKTHTNPDDIKRFMREILGPKLMVSTIFATAFVAPFLMEREQAPTKEIKNRPYGSSKPKEQLYLPTSSVGISLLSSTSFWSNEHQVQEFLCIIKSSFGLRPSSPVRSSSIIMMNMNNNSLWGTPRTPTEVMKNFQQQGRDTRSYNNMSETASAAMFFLGPDLASSFD